MPRDPESTEGSWIPGLPARLADRIVTVPFTGCWLWTGSVNSVTGYGMTTWTPPGASRRSEIGAHRLVFLLLRPDEMPPCETPPPRRLHVHHGEPVCLGKLCCNPDHTTIKDMADHARDHLLDSARNGRGAHSPEAREKRRLAQLGRRISRRGGVRRASCSSSFLGVTRRSDTGKWQAQVTVEGKSKCVGTFSDERAAAAAYDEAALRYRGAGAILNFPTLTKIN